MPAVNTKEIKYGIKAENYPDKILKDLQKVVGDVVKTHREIPKSVSDWKKELQFIKNDSDTINNKLRQQRDLVKSLSAAYKQAADDQRSSMATQMQAAETRLSNLTRQHSRLRQIMGSVNTHIGVQSQSAGHTGSPFVNNIMEGFAEGGIPGAGSALMKSGLGKLGLAGLAAYGIKKTYDWVQEKSEASRGYNIESQRMNYRYGLKTDLAGFSDMASPGAGSFHSNQEMMKMYGALGRSSGGVFLNNPAMMSGLAGYSRHQGLSFDETAGIVGHGVKNGLIDPNNPGADTGGMLNVFANAMSAGTKLGFDKSERIGQLVKLTTIANKDFLTVNKDSTNKIVAELRMVENMRLRGLTGDRAIEAINMTRNFFNPSQQSTPLFASWMMRDDVISPASKKTITGLAKGRSNGNWEGLLPAQQYALMQSSLQEAGQSMPLFHDIAQSYKKMPGGKGVGMLATQLGVDGKDIGKFMDLIKIAEKGDSKAFGAAYKSLIGSSHEDQAAKNELAHKAEQSEYLKAQKDLIASNIALRSVIDTEVSLRKFELGVATNIDASTGKLRKMSEADLKSYMDNPGIPDDMKVKIGEELKYRNRGRNSDTQAQILGYAGKSAKEFGVNKNLLSSLINAESGYDPNATGEDNGNGLGTAKGAMQLLDSTSRYYQVSNPYNSEQNIKGGTHYLSDLIKRYKGNEMQGVAAYHMGPGGLNSYLAKHKGKFDLGTLSEDNPKTAAYVAKVMNDFYKLEGKATRIEVVVHGAQHGATVRGATGNKPAIVSNVTSSKGAGH